MRVITKWFLLSLCSQWVICVTGQYGQVVIHDSKAAPRDEESEQDVLAKAVARLTITENDVVIAVMGVTGVGKSTFIEAATGQDIGIGHGLESCTTDVGVYAFEYKPGRRIFLIDTPGFDDTTRSDSEVLQDVAYFLSASYSKQAKLAGIIYLHAITDAKMKGSALKNLAMFQALCGDSSLEHVVLATTKWEQLKKKQIGVDRETELAKNPRFWRTMLDNGSRMFRHNNNRASALKIIDHIMNLPGNMVLDIQRQMVDQKRSLDNTSAGQELQRDLKAARLMYEKELRDVRESLDAAILSGNQQLMDEMRQLEAETAQRLADAEEERQRLKLSYEELQAKGEARYNERIEELNRVLEQKQKDYEKHNSRIQEELKRMRKEGKATADNLKLQAAAQHERDKRQIELLNAERDARERAIKARNEQNGLVAGIQGVIGLGLMGVGVLTGMNPVLMATGASMLGDATVNAMGSSDEL